MPFINEELIRTRSNHIAYLARIAASETAGYQWNGEAWPQTCLIAKRSALGFITRTVLGERL